MIVDKVRIAVVEKLFKSYPRSKVLTCYNEGIEITKPPSHVLGRPTGLETASD